jgi:hypothetical protein
MSSPELWNLDISLANHIAKKLREFATYNHGHPGNMTEREWKDKILGIATRLERYTERLDFPFELENEIVLEGQRAMKDLADILPSLWD